MNANLYSDGDALVPDALKGRLDSVKTRIVGALGGADRAFYERQFGFFAQVTGISGKLKPYIAKSKAEKKHKIDEEMRRIQVAVGVYLPSNPESTVLGIDYDSGRPLQSHAKARLLHKYLQKAPFMATFRIERDDGHGATQALWQSVIFKVGDDCRQDILALQLVAVFKGVFKEAGLPLYVYPYRVVATDPGCGVIEVIPDSASRDMIGREKVNNLLE